jgi:hypothetical protein
MPPTPFFGLSVMVHACIIFINRILGYNDPTKRKPPKINKPPASRHVSLAIIMSVLAVVMISASLLLYSAVIDKHSSIQFINSVMFEDLTHDKTNKSNSIYSTLNYIL